MVAYAYALAIIQFLYARSFWCDEAAIALNIMKRDYLGLLNPLDNLQGAPILYLWAVKTITMVFGTGEQSFRLLSLIFYLLAVPMMLKLLRRLFKTEMAVMAGLTFFVLNSRLLFYSGELKPYVGDIFWTLLLLLIVLSKSWSLQRRMVMLFIIGGVAIFSSFAMFAILPMIYLLMMYEGRKQWGQDFLRQMVLLGTAWAIAFGLFLVIFVKDHPSTAAQRAMFQKTKQLPPSNSFSSESLEYWTKSCKNLKRDFLLGVNNIFQTDQIPSKLQKTEIDLDVLYPVTFRIVHTMDLMIFALLLVMFLASLIRHQRTRLLWLLPLCIHAFMAILGLFPIANRLLLYAYPLIILVLVTGVEQLLIYIPRSKMVVTAGLIGYALFTSVALARSYIPHEVMEMRKVSEEVQTKLNDQQVVYVIPQAWTMFEYYQLQGVIRPAGEVVKGSRKSGDVGFKPFYSQIREISSEKWVFIGNIWDTQTQEMAQQLRSQGEVFLDSAISKGVRAYLFAARP
jgi:4-amino-4-deoxy-L-arabinose transferase-like glycosyltransferase